MGDIPWWQIWWLLLLPAFGRAVLLLLSVVCALEGLLIGQSDLLLLSWAEAVGDGWMDGLAGWMCCLSSGAHLQSQQPGSSQRGDLLWQLHPKPKSPPGPPCWILCLGASMTCVCYHEPAGLGPGSAPGMAGLPLSEGCSCGAGTRRNQQG